MSITTVTKLGLMFLVVLLSSCAGDGTGLDENGRPLGTVGPGPSTAATLSGDVQPIFTTNCAFSGCHGGTAPVLNQNLGAGLAFANIVNVASVEAPSLFRVHPGEPDSSYLVHKVQGTHAAVGGSGSRMPLGAGPLTATEIQNIRDWVEAGALDN